MIEGFFKKLDEDDEIGPEVIPIQSDHVIQVVEKEQIETGKKKGNRKNLIPFKERQQETEESLKRIIMSKADTLVRAGIMTAIGTTNIYKIDPLTKKSVLVISPAEQAKAIDGMRESGQNMAYLSDDEDNGRSKYFFATVKEPDYRAIDMLLNRAYGRPGYSVNFTGNVSFSIKDLAKKASEMEEEKKKAIPGQFTEINK
jgi:hypothetical protein